MAKNLGTGQIPKKMTVNGNEISGHEISNAFADFFENKVNDIDGNSIMFYNSKSWHLPTLNSNLKKS